jgi:uncharacterized protein (DUF4415 family)
LTHEDDSSEGEHRFVTLGTGGKGRIRVVATPIEKKQYGRFQIGKPISRNGGVMKSSSDNFHNKLKGFNFADAKPVSETPHLAKLQAQSGNKVRITMRVDSDVLAIFKSRAEKVGGNYQTLMNDALKQFAQGLTLSDMLRETVHDTLDECIASKSFKRENLRGLH